MLVVTSSITKPQIQNKSHKPTKSYQITRRRDSVRDWSATDSQLPTATTKKTHTRQANLQKPRRNHKQWHSVCYSPRSRQRCLRRHDYNPALHHNAEKSQNHDYTRYSCIHTIHWMLVVTGSITIPQILNKSLKPTKSYQISIRRDSTRDWVALTRKCQQKLPERPTQSKQTHKGQG